MDDQEVRVEQVGEGKEVQDHLPMAAASLVGGTVADVVQPPVKMPGQLGSL